jgi:hypothetical protein
VKKSECIGERNFELDVPLQGSPSRGTSLCFYFFGKQLTFYNVLPRISHSD